MKNILYLIIAILIAAWVLGFFVFAASSLIHILLVMAFLILLFRLLSK